MRLNPDEITLDILIDFWSDPKVGKRHIEDILDMLVAKKRLKDAGRDVYEPPQLTPSIKEKVLKACELRGRGYSCRDIAQIMGVSVGSVHKYVKTKWRKNV